MIKYNTMLIRQKIGVMEGRRLGPIGNLEDSTAHILCFVSGISYSSAIQY